MFSADKSAEIGEKLRIYGQHNIYYTLPLCTPKQQAILASHLYSEGVLFEQMPDHKLFISQSY
jgi:hypothetical protein